MGFAHMSSFIPVKRLKETKNLLAFDHPQPAYPVHILLVPKKRLNSLLDLSEEDSSFLVDLIAAVQEIVVERALNQTGYRLLANGGDYQDIPQLHFHLISGPPIES